jgi:hypothetical protein
LQQQQQPIDTLSLKQSLVTKDPASVIMSLTGNADTIPVDYASLNEEWILIHDQLHDEVLALYESNDDQDHYHKESWSLANLESMVMAARIGRLANIQNSLMYATNNSNESTSSINNSSCLLEQYLHQIQNEFDNDCRLQAVRRTLSIVSTL